MALRTPSGLFLVVLGALSLGSGCTPDGFGEGEPDEVDCVDLTRDWTPRAGTNYTIQPPTMVVEPGQEVIFCYYGSYEGETAGVVSLFPEPPQGFLHHTLLKRVDDEEFPDGTLMDCTDEEYQWPPKPTLFESVGASSDGDWINLPDGVAFKFEQGQRWVADIHYVNTSPDRLCVDTAFDLELVPEEQIEGYAGTFNLDAGGFSLPAGEETEESFRCAFPEQVSLLSIGGHMHSFGTAYDVSLVGADGQLEPLYQIPEWQDSYRYEPPIIDFAPGEVVLEAGQDVQTSCTWFNSTDEPLAYPDEMCTTFGVVAPFEDSFHCDDGHILVSGDGVLEGQVTRSVEPVGDGVGALHITVYTGDSSGQEDFQPLAFYVLEDADLSEDSSSVSYRIENIPIPEQAVFVGAFLDDDLSGGESGPASGDLVMMAPEEESQVELSAEGPASLDLDLNMMMP